MVALAVYIAVSVIGHNKGILLVDFRETHPFEFLAFGLLDFSSSSEDGGKNGRKQLILVLLLRSYLDALLNLVAELGLKPLKNGEVTLPYYLVCLGCPALAILS